MICTVQRGVWPLLANLQLHTPAGSGLTSAEEHPYLHLQASTLLGCRIHLILRITPWSVDREVGIPISQIGK